MRPHQRRPNWRFNFQLNLQTHDIFYLPTTKVRATANEHGARGADHRAVPFLDRVRNTACAFLQPPAGRNVPEHGGDRGRPLHFAYSQFSFLDGGPVPFCTLSTHDTRGAYETLRQATAIRVVDRRGTAHPRFRGDADRNIPACRP